MELEISIVALIENDLGEIILGTSHKWIGYGLPGGKPEPCEDEVVALEREIAQELDISLYGLVKLPEIALPAHPKIRDGKIAFQLRPYFARTHAMTLIHNREFKECGFYKLEDALQLDLLWGARQTIEQYYNITK